ncbi:PTS fructose transporter subunit IIB [Companilactobacillus sp. DQM5]|uniref:PTS fructose transporter subunit IIB n=1 Tax=Companilactobacillus sp. DQM5 TaxID=3463359 RepID=UPI004057E302
MTKLVKILTACGAGVNSSHQIADALNEEMKKRGHQVKADAYMVKDVNEELMSKYDIFTPIAKTDLGFTPDVPVIDAGPILYRMPAMADPVFNQVEDAVKKIENS